MNEQENNLPEEDTGFTDNSYRHGMWENPFDQYQNYYSDMADIVK